MRSIIEPFQMQYQQFMDEIGQKDCIRIGTLGPSGTSSEQAVMYLTAELNKISPQSQFKTLLWDDFAHVFRALEERQMDYALIPSAYENITDFFWNFHFKNVLNFIYHTPDYGLISKTDFELSSRTRLKVASCHAVKGILQYLTDGLLHNMDVEIVNSRSTTEAAILVLEGKADVGITNETSFELYKEFGLKFISKKYNTHIVWCLFTNK